MRLTGKIVVVTGNESGLGKALTLGLAAEGAKVVAASFVEQNAASAAGEIAAMGGDALGIAVDVTKESSVNSMIERTIGRFGRIDVLVNAATNKHIGMSHGHWDDITPEDWDNVISVSVGGTFLCCRAVLPHMQAQGSGSIINVSSPDALHGGPFLHYTAAMAGVMNFTRALAKQTGEFGTRVNAVAPGSLLSHELTKLLPADVPASGIPAQFRSLKRAGRPDDLVGAAIFLASDDSSFITGQTIVVDGGYAFH